MDSKMTKNVLVIPLEVIVGSQNLVERCMKAFFYFTIIVTCFYLCLMSLVETSYHFRMASIHLNPQKNSLSKNDDNAPNTIQEYSNEDVITNAAKGKEINSEKNTAKSSNSPNILFQTNNWVDEMSPVHYPWSNDTQCKDFTIKFAKNETFKPRRALVSFPGSGNSWLRYLIECSTGVFTGSLYSSKLIYEKGLYGELRNPNDGSTILQKTHYDTIFNRTSSTFPSVLQYNIDAFEYRGILVIRNPYKAIFSYWNFLKTNDQTAHVQGLNISDTEWIDHVEYSAEKWASVITTWVQNSNKLLIIQYEELKKNPRPEIIGILNYLNVPINTKRLDCLLKKDNLEGPFHREKKVTNEKLQVESAFLSTKVISLPHIYKDIYPSPLDTVISDKIQEVNALFNNKDIPIHLDYIIPN